MSGWPPDPGLVVVDRHASPRRTARLHQLRRTPQPGCRRRSARGDDYSAAMSSPVTFARDRFASLLGDAVAPGAFSARRTARPDDLRLEVRGVGPSSCPSPSGRRRSSAWWVGRPGSARASGPPRPFVDLLHHHSNRRPPERGVRGGRPRGQHDEWPLARAFRGQEPPRTLVGDTGIEPVTSSV
jgi:hypothetical protein